MGSWMTQQLYIAMGSDRCYHTQAWVGGSWVQGKEDRKVFFVCLQSKTQSRSRCGCWGSITVSGNESREDLDVGHNLKRYITHLTCTRQ